MQKIIDLFGMYPLQVIGLAVLIPIFILMIYDYRFNFKNQLEGRVKGYIKNENDEKFLDRAVDRTSGYLGTKGDEIQLKLQRANILFKKEEYLALMIIGVIFGAFIGFTLFPLGTVFKAPFSFIHSPFIQIFFARLLAALVFGALGYFLPELYIRYLIFDRRRLLNEQIEDALLQLADALHSGADIVLAIKMASEELKYPMQDEFFIVYQELETNKPLDDALEALKNRVNLEDFSLAISAIQIQSETGASLEPLLREIVKVVADRKILKLELEKAVSESKFTGVVLMAAPVVFTAIFAKSNAESYVAMLTSPIGLGMIVIGVACYTVGSLLIFKILRDVSRLT